MVARNSNKSAFQWAAGQKKPGPLMRWLLCLSAVMGIAGWSWAAGITYRPADRIIRVSDYPAGWPCTPERLYYMDRFYGWGVMTYDEARDVYTLNASLWVGDNDGTETFFQIGRGGHTNETLIVNGNVAVYPYYIKGQNPELYWWYAEKKANRVTIGDASNAVIKAALKIGSAKGSEHTLYVGVVPMSSNRVLNGSGGQMHVFNGTITAALQDNEHAIGAADGNRMVYWLGDSLVLQGATLSWMAGFMAYGNVGNSSNTIFEHGGTGLIPGKVRHAGAVFRNLKTAILDYGGCEAELVDCVFTNNECNWSLANGGKGIVTIDCQIAPSTKGDVYGCRENPKTKTRQYPAWISRRHIVVAVTDGAGAPVTGATVNVVCEQSEDAELIENRRIVTDSTGRTPGKGSRQALLLTEQIVQATDTLNQPKTNKLTYALTVTATNCSPAVVKGIAPAASWQVVPVTVKK